MLTVEYFKRFIGLSTDTKPTDDVPPGSRFLETDTDKVYIYTGVAWVLLIATAF